MLDIEPSLFSLNIVNVLSISTVGIFQWFRRKGKERDMLDRPDTEAYVHRGYADRTTKLERVSSKKEIGKLGANDRLLVINTAPFEAELVFPDLVSKDGVSLDATVKVACRVSDPRKFLQECALDWLAASDSVSITQLETWMINCCSIEVREEVQVVQYDAMKQREGLPASWWMIKLPGWMGTDWLKIIEVTEARYESMTADKAAEIASRRKQFELEEESRQQINQHEVRMQHEQLEYENAKRELELAADLSEKDRQARLKQAELTYEKAILEATSEIERIRMQNQKERAEMEAEIDRLHSREDLAAERLKQAQESERRTKEYLDELTAAREQLGDQAELLRAAIQEGLEDAKRISDFAGSTSSTTMALIGKTAGPEYLSRILREKANTDPDAVKAKKSELRTRDIGTTPVDSLGMNSSLQFEFMSQRPGYATVLNIGTSSTVRLHSPNAYVGVDEAKIEAGRAYSIPGEPGGLLPYEDLRRNGLSYLEVGPPGWEVLAVIVTPERLIGTDELFESTARSPFVALSESRIGQIADQLAELPDDAWNAGLLSFLVE